MRVLFIHGRAQEGKDPVALKKNWIETLDKGLTAAGVSLPSDVSFDFPFYGDKLDEFTADANLPTPADVASKGSGQNRKFEEFMQSALDEIYKGSQITQADVEALVDDDGIGEKGIQNWGWVQAIARAIDNRYPGFAEATIEQFLRDVYLYVNTPGVARGIDAIIEDMLTDEPTVVVGHSLGSVVGYKVILNNMSRMNFRKYVTVGSPLGLKAISSKLGIPENPLSKGWYNAYDDGDIVALNPLNEKYFPTDPPIVNNDGVQNHTDNQHGIIGYLNDANVANAIADGLSTT